MLGWKKRKRGSSKQKGNPFLSRDFPKFEARQRAIESRTVSGDFGRDVAKERYVRSIIRESKTHDVSTSLLKLKRQAKQIIRDLKKADKAKTEAEQKLSLAQAKLEVLKRTIEVLLEIRQERTRVGDSELKMIMRKHMAELNVPASVF